MIEDTQPPRAMSASASPPHHGSAPSSLGAFGGDGRPPGPSTQEAAWRERGRALYGVPEPAPTPMILSIAEARQTIARRLRTSLHCLSEGDRDAAIAAAARGYLDAHIERGHSVSAHSPPSTPRPRLAEVAVTPDPSAPEAPLPLIAHGRYGHAPARRVRAPSSVGSVTFQVTLGHALAKGLAGGRVRITPGESAIDAIARRIVRDTRCAIVAMQDDGEELGSDGTRMLRNYRITLRGSDGTREVAGRDIEGVLWVRF
jgi:hypothetical protein